MPPNTINRTITPRRRPNAELRTREYLTEQEVEALIEAAGTNRHGHRDATMILVAYRHGLRVSELTDLRWEQIDFRKAVLHVRRLKAGTPATHPLQGDELRALRKLQREQVPPSPFVFTSMRKGPFSTAGFARMLERAGIAAGLAFQAHPAHAAPCLRVHVGQQGDGYPDAAGLPGPQEHPAHRALHRAVTHQV